MSTLIYALIASIALVYSQYDADCGTTTITVGGEDNTMQLERDETNEMVRITLTGPNDKWFGFVIGQGTMNGGYGITGQGDTTYELVERELIKQSGGGNILTSSGNATATLNGNGVLVLERPWVGPNDNYFDFTELMTCQVTSISIAGALGGGLSFAKHTDKRPSQTYTASEVCCPTTDPSESPTESPASPSDSDAPTMAPEDPTSSEEAEEPDYVICGESELFTDVALTVFRDADNEQVKIEISGPNDQWFGYGFGTAKMTGSYAVVVEGEDSDSLDVAQYVLAKPPSAPGTLKAYGTTSITTSDGSAVGALTMDYDAADFDFTDFLTCQVDSIDLIAAIGTSTPIAYHGEDQRIEGETLTRLSTCTCDSTPTSTASANNIFNMILGMFIIHTLFM